MYGLNINFAICSVLAETKTSKPVSGEIPGQTQLPFQAI
jgi:hypothetical protein